MATDATGTPTPLGIPKYNPNVDAPSGLGFNAAMDAIDSLIAGRVGTPAGIAAGEVPVWDGSAWVRSSATRIGASSLGSGTPNGSTLLRGDSSWVIPGGTEITYAALVGNFGPTGVTGTGDGDHISDLGSVTTEAVKYYFELSGLAASGTANDAIYFRLHEGTNASLGALIDEVQIGIPTTGVAIAFFLRTYFTPAAGTRSYTLRWRGAGGGMYTLYNSINPLIARIVKA